MDRKTLVKMFQGGLLVSVTVERLPISDNYQLVVRTSGGKTEPLTVTRSNDSKHYSSVQAALNDAQAIGFKEISVVIN